MGLDAEFWAPGDGIDLEKVFAGFLRLEGTTHIGWLPRAIWERLHPVGRRFGFHWVQNRRGGRYTIHTARKT